MCAPFDKCYDVINNYLKSINIQKRKNFVTDKMHDSLDDDNRSNYLSKMDCLYEIYMQALEDVGIFLNRPGFLQACLDIVNNV